MVFTPGGSGERICLGILIYAELRGNDFADVNIFSTHCRNLHLYDLLVQKLHCIVILIFKISSLTSAPRE